MICLDASVAVKLVIDEPDSEFAERLLGAVAARGELWVASALLPYEVANGVWQRRRRGLFTPALADEALAQMIELPVRYRRSADLLGRAWAVTVRLGLPSVDDAQDLAVAEDSDCPIWTADVRLAQAARTCPGPLRVLGQDPIPHA